MARSKPKTTTEEQLTLADNPSLIVVGEETHLRVLDDFFCELELPKWKKFKENWEGLKKDLKTNYSSVSDIESAIKKLDDPDLQKEYQERLKSLKKNKKKLDDDRWGIQGKHEESVNSAITKVARLAKEPNWIDKIKIKLGLMKAPVPVDVAFNDLKEHLLHVSTEEMARKMDIVLAVEKNFRENGQYVKADKIKLFRNDLVTEMTLIEAGYDTFVTEEMMIDFIKRSERGVMVDFLRYYDGIIPEEVSAKKREADSKMIFDNYVVAFYQDIKKKAVTVAKETKKKEAKREVDRRRDPILFGVIKESRKLVYITDWVTDTDDLTLEVLEEALGKKSPKLSERSADEADSVNSINTDLDRFQSNSSESSYSYVDYDSTRRMVRYISRLIGDNNG